MSRRDESTDHLLVVQLNGDLRSAQLDLLSAQCATDRLRLRFSPDTIARHGDRELLRKATSSANALHEFYRMVAKVADSSPAGEEDTDLTQAP